MIEHLIHREQLVLRPEQVDRGHALNASLKHLISSIAIVCKCYFVRAFGGSFEGAADGTQEKQGHTY